MHPFDSGLEMVISHLENRRRLLHQSPGVASEILQRLAQARRPAVATGKRQPVPMLAPKDGAGVAANFLTSGDKVARMEALRAVCLPCTKCPHLAASRTQVVFGVGNLDAALMFVGEAPGEDEDLQGEPFVGKAGQLLTKMISAMGLSREEVFIGNVLKCRPDLPSGVSGNRKPTRQEMETCLPWLREQIDIVRPQVLVGLGATALEGLLGETRPMNQMRGRWQDFQGTPLMATYHPAYLLRNQAASEKRKVWEDLLLVMEKLALPISAKQRGFFLK